MKTIGVGKGAKSYEKLRSPTALFIIEHSPLLRSQNKKGGLEHSNISTPPVITTNSLKIKMSLII